MSQDEGPWVESHWVPVICCALTNDLISVVLPAVHRFNGKDWGRLGFTSTSLTGETDGFTAQEVTDILTQSNMIAYHQQHYFPLPRATATREEAARQTASAWEDLLTQIWTGACTDSTGPGAAIS